MDPVPSRLSLLPSLMEGFDVCPSMDMVRSTRLYACQEEDIPKGVLCPTSMRTLYSILVESKANAFISKEKVFVTKKNIARPRDLKQVAVEDLCPSFELRKVRIGICDFLLNEVFPTVCPMSASQWSLEFLVDFDNLLNIPINNQCAEVMRTFNFRSLKHRICMKHLNSSETKYIKTRLPLYAPLLEVFQDFVFT